MITDLALPIHVALSPLGYVKLPIRPFEISVQCVLLQDGGLIGAFRYFWMIKETVCMVLFFKIIHRQLTTDAEPRAKVGRVRAQRVSKILMAADSKQNWMT